MNIEIVENNLPPQAKHYQQVIINIINSTEMFLESYGEDISEESKALIYIKADKQAEFDFRNLPERVERIFRQILHEYYNL